MAEAILYVDTFEPQEGFDLLAQVVPVQRNALNVHGFADYYWQDLKGSTRQWERQQIGEACGDLDSLEELLNGQLATCDELTWVVEGIARPTVHGIQTFKLSRDGKFFHPYMEIPPPNRRPQPGLWARFEGMKDSFRKAGIIVVETITLENTIHALAAAFRGSLKPERTTLRRYVTPHIAPMDKDPHVDNLCRLRRTGIGPALAQKLVARFGSFYGVIMAGDDEVIEVLGPTRAYKFWEVLGREE